MVSQFQVMVSQFQSSPVPVVSQFQVMVKQFQSSQSGAGGQSVLSIGQ